MQWNNEIRYNPKQKATLRARAVQLVLTRTRSLQKEQAKRTYYKAKQLTSSTKSTVNLTVSLKKPNAKTNMRQRKHSKHKSCIKLLSVQINGM